jgi:hypothetical protein
VYVYEDASYSKIISKTPYTNKGYMHDFTACAE